MVRSVAGNLPEQVKNNQSVNTAAGNGGQKMSQYSWFTVYVKTSVMISKDGRPTNSRRYIWIYRIGKNYKNTASACMNISGSEKQTT